MRGKDYTTVPLRVQVFRSNLDVDDLKSTPNVFTHLKIYDSRVISKTYLAKNIDIHLNENGNEIVTMEKVLAVGTAEEIRNSNNINKTSAVENAETSSVGRSLGFLSIGIDTSIASYNEVANAVTQQKDKPKTIPPVNLKDQEVPNPHYDKVVNELGGIPLGDNESDDDELDYQYKD